MLRPPSTMVPSLVCGFWASSLSTFSRKRFLSSSVAGAGVGSVMGVLIRYALEIGMEEAVRLTVTASAARVGGHPQRAAAVGDAQSSSNGFRFATRTLSADDR